MGFLLRAERLTQIFVMVTQKMLFTHSYQDHQLRLKPAGRFCYEKMFFRRHYSFNSSDSLWSDYKRKSVHAEKR